ncbi:MAG: hypothetical protein KAX05_04845 [Bacteroidales bacterium]|nr:hypothetical protein [Bacteroidales bacterium]
MNQLMYNEDTIIYELTVQDIQTVANQELERNLTNNEIERIIDLIAENISWYEAISSAIEKKINVIN